MKDTLPVFKMSYPLLHTRIWVTDVTPIMESPLKLESPAVLYKLWICFLRLRAVYVGFNTRFLEP